MAKLLAYQFKLTRKESENSVRFCRNLKNEM